MRRCVRCIQTETYPGIELDAEGLCSICRAFDRRWAARDGENCEAEFLCILGKARRRNSKYNALVGLSGGKDSCYLLHLMVKRYNANVLVFTHDNGFLSDGARKNIDLMVEALGVEHRYITRDAELLKRSYRALIKNECAELCMLCTSGGVAAVNSLVLREKIPMVMLGFSPQTEPILPLEIHSGYDYRFLVNAAKPHVKRSELRDFKYASLPWMFYTIFIRRIRWVFLPRYVEWNDQEILELLPREYGWHDYGHGKPHFDCLLNPAVDYFTRQRLGACKVQEKLSQMVRCGQIAREEALERLKEEDPVEEPVDSVDVLCKRLDLTRDDFKPFLDGSAKDYHHFKSYTSLFHRFSWVFWLAHKLGFMSEDPYLKYR